MTRTTITRLALATALSALAVAAWAQGRDLTVHPRAVDLRVEPDLADGDRTAPEQTRAQVVEAYVPGVAGDGIPCGCRTVSADFLFQKQLGDTAVDQEVGLADVAQHVQPGIEAGFGHGGEVNMRGDVGQTG